MTIKHQSPFKEGEVLQIQNRLLDSARTRHAENMVEREAYRALFGDDWLEGEAVADLDDDELSADLNELLADYPVELSASSRMVVRGKPEEHPVIASGLFASASSNRPRQESGKALHFPNQMSTPCPTIHADAGVNAKSSPSNRRGHSLSTPGRAGLIASFSLSHAERVVAISKLDPLVDHDQLQTLEAIDAFIQKLTREYQGTGELPDWAKFVSPQIKQFFRIFHQCRKPDSKTLTIRVDHKTAEAALAAPRGPANYLAEIIKRTLAKLGIETDLAFNLEFNHTGRTENHPAHIHGALCIPDDRALEVSEALRRALAAGYRQRYKNLAVHVEAPRSARSWATYCIKEYESTAIRLSVERGCKTRPDYSTHKLTQEAKAFHEEIGDWLNA
ncbi:hypothetical protein [Pseudomonas sp. DWP3-1-2]|uniref:hypothetical protein n=1 Tax=Pseudomonas sp. DWP3-1-2 TaxID=2804645 RepID=UPI003CFB23EE